MVKIKLSDCIAPSFYNIHNFIREKKYLHYLLGGGRGSTKSSFCAIEIILNLEKDFKEGKKTNAVCVRKFNTTLRDSVFSQMSWAKDNLGLSNVWELQTSPMLARNTITNQMILFKGTDQPKKLKSLKFLFGYCKYVWFEEVDELAGESIIRSLLQSLLRGGNDYLVFYSYNPPKNTNNWVNLWATEIVPNRLSHKSTYLEVPSHWLGQVFIDEAKHLEKTKPDLYEHEYLGVSNGTGGEIFKNLEIRSITYEEIESFENVKRGLDWGYATDPLHYTENSFDKKKNILYIYDEISEYGMSNQKLSDIILSKQLWQNSPFISVICDSAEPKSIDDLKNRGIRTVASKKGPGSIEYGIKWLQGLDKIIIDPVRCPATKREFMCYSLEAIGDGNFKNNYPDKNNHSIDSVRYSRENETRERKIKYLK